MKKSSIISICVAIVVTGAVALWLAIEAPARAVERNLAAVNSLSVGQTTEAELLSRKEFQSLDRTCGQATCFYFMRVENSALSNLRLAPHMYMSAMVQVREGLVINVSVTAARLGSPGITVSQVQALPKECSSTPCLRRLALPNKFLMSYNILFDNQSDLRNHMPQVFNASCWSRLHGCSSYAEFVPLIQGMKLEEAATER